MGVRSPDGLPEDGGESDAYEHSQSEPSLSATPPWAAFLRMKLIDVRLTQPLFQCRSVILLFMSLRPSAAIRLVRVIWRKSSVHLLPMESCASTKPVRVGQFYAGDTHQRWDQNAHTSIA